MKEIPLSKNGKHFGKYVALVDDEDYDELIKHNWHVRICSKSHLYAVRYKKINGLKLLIKMHRQILSVKDKKILVDHKDHNGLNNQRSNIRICNTSENLKNCRKKSNTSSKYLGVYLSTCKRVRKNGNLYFRQSWVASIRVNKKKKFLGSFSNEIEAAIAYNLAATLYHGEFANLNIVTS